MSGPLRPVDDFLRGRGPFAVGSPARGRVRQLLALIVAGGFIYGAVMASYASLAPGRWHHMIYVGIKVPLLLLVTSALCLPSFFVVNTVAGLRDDFGEALHAVFAGQACVTLVLASLAPVTGFFYVSCRDYNLAVLFNAAMFTVACLAAQLVMRRYYGPLIRRAPRHGLMLGFWFFLYAFVGIEMGWILRPFIGDPRAPVQFLRPDAWGNAYVVVIRLFWLALRRSFGG
jgi:hypothetical protein